MSTPNGKKVQIFLEELKEKYGTECKLHGTPGNLIQGDFPA